ncbi:uncharacterized protein LOC133896259 [Phragmites australis]|uniref:uncharacterized protein LOC133896259 n=1 Tax=Phragmites australis TaxID=29695 RepID=UPI002D78C79F|nr:uncharacterized protein LOC133896259 [Phragmites australis]
MEIDWPDIFALRVTCPEGGPGTLEIMLSRRPRFSRETNQQPRRSTAWLGSTDFTSGQASMHRRHLLQCAPGILNAHIVKLLSCSHRLYSLSQENTIDQENPCFEQWHSEYEVQGSSSTQDLYHHYYSHEFWPQKFGELVSMSIGTNVVGRNHNGSQQEGMPILIPSSAPKRASVITRTSSGGLQLQGDMFNCNNSSFQTPRRTQLSISNRRTMNDTASYMANPSKQQNLNLASVGTSSSSLIRPEDVRKFVKDIRSTNQPDRSWVTPMYSDGSSSQMTIELDLSNYAFNNTAQTFQQIDPRNPPSNDNATMAAMALEKLSHYLLSDSDTEPAGAAEEAVIMSRVNSLSKLSQQDLAQSSQASNATRAPPPPPPIDFEAEAATQVLNGDSCRGNGLLPSTGMQSMPWQQEPVVDIEMDMAYMSELLPFCP